MKIFFPIALMILTGCSHSPSKDDPETKATHFQMISGARSIASGDTTSDEHIVNESLDNSDWVTRQASSQVGDDSPYSIDEKLKDDQSCELLARQKNKDGRPEVRVKVIRHAIQPAPPILGRVYSSHYGWNELPLQDYKITEPDDPHFFEEYKNGELSITTKIPEEGPEAYRRIRIFFSSDFTRIANFIYEVRQGGSPKKDFRDRALLYKVQCSPNVGS